MKYFKLIKMALRYKLLAYFFISICETLKDGKITAAEKALLKRKLIDVINNYL